MYVFPFAKPDTAAECAVVPAPANVFVIDEYSVPDVVEYLHVAASFVVSDIVVDVVPAAKVPVGCPLLRVGGVVSGGVPDPVLFNVA